WNAFDPIASAMPGKVNRPLVSELVVAPVSTSFTGRFGSVWPASVTVSNVVWPSPVGGESVGRSRSDDTAGGVVSSVNVTAEGSDLLPSPSVAWRWSVWGPSASGEPLI